MVTEPNNNVNTTVEYQTAMLNSDSKLKVGIYNIIPWIMLKPVLLSPPISMSNKNTNVTNTSNLTRQLQFTVNSDYYTAHLLHRFFILDHLL